MSSSLQIPRLLHRVWLGDSPLPELFSYYGETWARHNPSWEVKLWTDRELATLPFSERVGQGEWIAERSDLFRYELLNRFGGVYVDTDMECLRPIEPLLDSVEAFAAWEAPDRLGNAILGFTPGHPAVALTLEHAYGALQSQRAGRIRTAGPTVTRAFKGRSDVTVFGVERFYPPVRRKEARWLSDAQPPIAPADLERLRELADSNIALTKNASSFEWPNCTYAVHHVSGLGRERIDPYAEIDRLNEKLDEARRKERRLRNELNDIKASRWWRVSSALRVVPSRAGRGGAQARR